MADLFENPMGLDGFEFVEFASPTPGVLEPVFEMMGFTAVAKHRSKNVTLYRQGDINFILNEEPRSHAAYFAEEHGPCACGMAFRVKDSHVAYDRALELGVERDRRPHPHGSVREPSDCHARRIEAREHDNPLLAIGINNAMAQGSENIGFAIPVDTVREVFENDLLSSGK